jgi:hypothetical protein
VAQLQRPVIRLTTRIDWQTDDDTRLRKDGWYLIISNHMSWTDIVVLGHLFRNRLPVPKFFMKHELIYIPLLGLACWGLDMPYAPLFERVSLRNPHLRQGYRDHPQRLREVSPHTHHRHQLRGGDPLHRSEARGRRSRIAISCPQGGRTRLHPGSHGRSIRQPDQRHHQLPDNPDNPFKDFLMGKMKRIRVRIEELPVDEQLVGDYFNDKQFKRGFQEWLNARWKKTTCWRSGRRSMRRLRPTAGSQGERRGQLGQLILAEHRDAMAAQQSRGLALSRQ